MEHTTTVISSPGIAADTTEGRVSFSVHTTISSTVTTIIITTTLTGHWPITLVESSTGTVTSCIQEIKSKPTYKPILTLAYMSSRAQQTWSSYM